MKKFISFILCCSLLCIFAPTAKADQELIVDNFPVHSNYHEFTSEELMGTKFQGKQMVYFDGVAYISDPFSQVEQDRAAGIAIFIGGILVGYLIDGVVLYTTGYTGAELTATAISSLVDAIREINDSIAEAYYASYMSRVNRVVTRSGRDCVAAGGGLWRCTMAEFGEE